MGYELDEQVDRYLRESMSAHEAARGLRRQRANDANAVLARAYQLRQSALELDPERTSPAWQSEVDRIGRDIHADLMAFYERHVS